jgi:hypothetical protein
MKAIEIKSGSTIQPDYFSNIEKLEAIATRPMDKFLVYGGQSDSMRKNTMILPWFETEKIM